MPSGTCMCVLREEAITAAVEEDISLSLLKRVCVCVCVCVCLKILSAKRHTTAKQSRCKADAKQMQRWRHTYDSLNY